MLRLSVLLSCLAVSMIALVGFSGCGDAGDSEQTPAASQPEASVDGDHDEHGEGEHADHATGDDAEVKEALAQLSDEDRAIAVAQKTCPVTDELLGSAGKPVKVTAKDRTVFVCCAMCKSTFEEDPDKYLAKLDK